jgi:hypothetical protein
MKVETEYFTAFFQRKAAKNWRENAGKDTE